VTDASLAETLRKAFLTATGCKTKSAKLFFDFTCNVVNLYSNNADQLPGYLAYMQSKYPTLTALLMDHIGIVFSCYIE